MKVLILDIETAPNIAYVWAAWKQNIYQKQWVKKSHIMSFAAKWLHHDEVMYKENRKEDDAVLVKELFNLLDEADIVVAHNGKKFDIPMIIGRGVVHQYKPPSPFFVVDTCVVARQELRLVSNSLANLCEELNLPLKQDHEKFPGFELWLECLRGNDEAWEEMKDYNVADIVSLEALYLRLLPYMKHHPNVSTFIEGEVVECPKCSSKDNEKRGTYRTKSGLTYQRFRCKSCGGWHRSRRKTEDPSPQTVNAV